MKHLLTAAAIATLLAGCTEIQVGSHLFKRGYGATSCKREGDLKVGNPYIVDGITYKPVTSSLGYSERGIASWYGKDFHGKSTANGECYNMYAFTAAHKTLPLPTLVRVTNLENNKSIVVKVQDRGPFVRGRMIDLSYAAAQSLDIVRTGTAPVLVEAIGGPHHKSGGAGWFASNQPQRSSDYRSGDSVAEALPTYVPTTASEELLEDEKFTITKPATTHAATEKGTELAAAEEAPLVEENASPIAPPPANKNLPVPPAADKRPFRSTEPLLHTAAYVQVGAFSNEQKAHHIAKNLGKGTQVTSVQRASGMLYRVRTGPFKTLAAAETELDKLISRGFNGAAVVIEKK